MKEVVFKITNNCPCSCNFCESGNGRFLFIDFEAKLWEKIALEMCNNGLQVAIISGGEPLLRPQLVNQLIKLFHEYGVYVVLNTSGATFENGIFSILEFLPDLIIFSIDSTSPTLHDSRRGFPGLFSKLNNAIEQIHDANIVDMPIGLRFVLTKNNFFELPRLIEFCSNHSIDLLRITNIENDIEHRYSLSDKQIKTLFSETLPETIHNIEKSFFEIESLRVDAIKKIRSLYSGLTPFELTKNMFSPHLIDNAYCPLKGEFVMIGSSGEIYPCCESEHHRYPVLSNITHFSYQEICDNLSKIQSYRFPYCKYCTLSRNVQINFSSKSINLANKCIRDNVNQLST